MDNKKVARELVKLAKSLMAKTGEFYIANSSIFDTAPGYKAEMMIKILKDNGIKAWKENAYGFSNQPEVVVFKGDDKKVEEIIEEHASDIHPKIKKWGVSIYEKDWE